ncbi:MAG: thiamine phosphate synthase [Propionibacteriaceae bacterium]|nr:thiamine phosphate synthase [Propionibacteriaceae bacterium]
MTVLWGLATRLRLARLGFVTDTRGGGPEWERYCHDLFLAGVNLILIDEPGLDRAKVQAAVQGGLRAGFGSGRIVGVAQSTLPAFGVDLAHLSTLDDVEVDNDLIPLVGRPAQSNQELNRWIKDPTTAYVSVGPVRDAGETVLTRGLGLVARAAAVAPAADPTAKPWFATGGVDDTNFDAVWAAGARRVLVHRAIAQAADPLKTAREWANRLRLLWRDDPDLKDYGFAIRRADRGDD